MIARYENRSYAQSGGAWVGRYRNAANLLHWHYDCELIFVDKGRCTLNAAGRSYLLEQGQAAFVAAGVLHSIASEPNCELVMCCFYPQVADAILNQRYLKSARLSRDYGILQVIERIDRALRCEDRYREMEIGSIIVTLMIDIYRNEATEPVDRYAPMVTLANRFGELLEAVDKDYAEMTCPRAAAIMGYTANYFSAMFRKMTGIPFSVYVNEVKVEKAIRLLQEENCPVAEVAARCGFHTTRNFNRVFKEITGVTPREFSPTAGLRTAGGYTTRFDPTLGETVLLPIHMENSVE